MTGLTPYYGEFLSNPIPLECSIVEPCDYACNYCFANLNKRYWASKTPGKKQHGSEVVQVMGLLANFRKRSTLEAKLLQDGYPILLSNRTDPFSRKNRGSTIPMLEVMGELGIKASFQTKGFIKPDDFETVMGLVQYPSCWYVSIAFDDDELRQKIEPGAPTIESRHELITQLRERGHSVVVGVNPCVSDWIKNPEQFLLKLKELGVWGVWAEILHFNSNQTRNLTPRERDNLTESVISKALRRTYHPDDVAFLDGLLDMAEEIGLCPFNLHRHKPSNFWAPWWDNYEMTFPIMQDFINEAWTCLDDGDVLTFDNFASIMSELPNGKMRLGHYVGASAADVTRDSGKPWSNYMTYEELLKMIWNNQAINQCPVNLPCFSFAAEYEGEIYHPLLDENGDSLMVFHREGFRHFYVDLERQEKHIAA